MAKKVLIISTSFRGDINSYVLAKECAKGAKEAGHDVESLSLKGKDVEKQKLPSNRDCAPR